ncbi:hypothetical protein A7U60_g8598 [Sanghuangporus baumii]|uniref:Membrane anchor Opy2 N-terminal domain-containing protein n=1 Tax=Sanghuangporus baumii TaxID=108892 RepID=A0A9Q5HRE5_SANBA|nr:hypothetical protein A7U60_g8598 [Sanghuangporus baumii]
MHLHDDIFLHRRCVECPDDAPACSCGVGFQCIITSRACDACPSASCVSAADTSSSGNSGGVSGGAIAGAVVGALVLLAASVALLFYCRRRLRAEKTRDQPAVEPKPDVPARAEAVLSRPDPVEKPRSPSPSPHEPESVRMYSVMSNSTINLDPQAAAGGPPSQNSHPSNRGSVQSNPFNDTHSIQTTSASTQSTNVIPIALVPHGSVSSPPHSPASDSPSSGASSSAPARPARSPDLGLHFGPLSSGLNLEHVNVSKDSFRPPNAHYAQSQVSGLSGFSSRDSVMTSGSFASDVLYEAPQIVTNAGRVNVLKAEVVSVQGTAPGTPMPSSSGGQSLKPAMASRMSKGLPARSPLAQSSFGPTDAVSVSESDAEGQEIEYHPQRNPFGDEHSSRLHTGNTTTTFGGTTPIPIPSTASPNHQYPRHRADEQDSDDSPASGRPLSTLTQATSIIGAEIGGATVVRLNSTGSANNRLTSARLVTPTSGPLRSQDDRVLQQQQAQALAAARARAAASGLPMPGTSSHHSITSSSSGSSVGGSPNPAYLHSRRVSEASVMSAGADSLLESFTFVPPSPIANRPLRSPSSPLATQTAVGGVGGVPPVPPLPKQINQNQKGEKEEQTKRQVQGLSSASTGIEGYDFRIDDGQGGKEQQTQASVPSTISNTNTNTNTNSNLNSKVDTPQRSRNTSANKPPPSAASNNLNGDGTLKGRQRASLDTLALTADLSAFPLNFDEGRGSFGVSK